MKEGWKKEFKDKMSGYTEPAPEGLFEDIMASYDASAAGRKNRRRVLAVIVPGLAAAAAIAVAVVLGYDKSGSAVDAAGPGTDTHLLAQTQSVTEESPEAPQDDMAGPAAAESGREVHTAADRRDAVPGYVREEVPEDVPERQDTEGLKISGQEDISGETPELQNTETPETSGQEESGQVDIIPRDPYDWQHILLAENDRPAASRRPSFSVYASGLSGGSTSHSGYSSPVREAAMAPMAYGDNSLAGIMTFNRTRDVSTESEHFLPLRVGLAVSYRFTPHWSIETGIAYSWLLSKSRTGSDSYYVDSRQELHYLGIPLNISYNVWDSRWMRVYFSAGGMLEKCVGGRVRSDFVYSNDVRDRDTESLIVRPLQWSCGVSAGLQVNLTGLVGIYVEPGTTWHFRNSSDVETVYSEHPLNFNLNLGLRFSIGGGSDRHR